MASRGRPLIGLPWQLLIASVVGAIVIDSIGAWSDSKALQRIGLLLGTVVAVSTITVDVVRRYAPVRITRIVIAAIIVADVAVLLVNDVGSMLLSAALAVTITALSLLMALQYLKVSSGRGRALGLFLISIGALGLVLPLQYSPFHEMWMWMSTVCALIALYGQRMLEASPS